jgi:D-3-phosphoglycerate dehydrogenase
MYLPIVATMRVNVYGNRWYTPGMEIAVVEPLGLSREALERIFEPLTADGHTIRYHDARPTSTAETIERIGSAEIAIITNSPFPREVLDRTNALRYLAVAFTGVNHVDVEACREKGVAVSNAAGFSTDSVAELSVAMIISLMRNVIAGDPAVRSGGTNAGLFGRELRGKSVGVVGTGAIGRRVAELLTVFGVRLLGYNRTRYPEMEALGMQYLPLAELLAAADIVTVHVALTPETTTLIGERELSAIKPGAYLVNLARGAVLDSEAAAAALSDGRLAGLATDVYETEPPIDPAHPLLQAPNTLLLPHVAFGTNESFTKRAEITLDNIQGFLRGDQRRVVVPAG